MMRRRSASSIVTQRPISSIVRLQPTQCRLLRSIVQMPMQGETTRGGRGGGWEILAT
jgi:hypothetical protein